MPEQIKPKETHIFTHSIKPETAGYIWLEIKHKNGHKTFLYK